MESCQFFQLDLRVSRSGNWSVYSHTDSSAAVFTRFTTVLTSICVKYDTDMTKKTNSELPLFVPNENVDRSPATRMQCVLDVSTEFQSRDNLQVC